MQPHDWWSFEGWYYFAGIAVAGVLTKYFIRYQGRHLFNPSNIALVAAFVIFGAERIEPLDFWWGPFGWAMLLAYLLQANKMPAGRSYLSTDTLELRKIRIDTARVVGKP